MNHPIPGPNYVPEYQVAGLPFATSSVNSGVVRFPFVTQWVQVSSITATSSIGFTEAGLNASNKFTVVSGSGTQLYPWKLKELWVSGNVQVIAGLTMVPREKMWDYVHSGNGFQTPTSSLPSFTTFGYDGI